MNMNLTENSQLPRGNCILGQPITLIIFLPRDPHNPSWVIFHNIMEKHGSIEKLNIIATLKAIQQMYNTLAIPIKVSHSRRKQL